MNAWAQKYAPFVGVAAVTALCCFLFMGPESRNDSHWWRAVIAGAGVLSVVGWAVASGLAQHTADQLRRGIRTLMVISVVFGIFNYWQFDKKVFGGLGDYTDITYYYVNSKYLGELGYFRLYAAMILADKELNDHHSSKIRNYRDLRDYEVKNVRHAYEHGRKVKEQHFTPERWEAFRQDIDWFLARKTTRSMQSNFYVDHGYNPPPTWSLVGKALASLADAEHVKRIAMVDVLFVGAMFVGVGWAFGFDAVLFAMLFWVCTFSGRWPILGEALLRFDWVSCLALAMCFLKKGKPWHFAVAGGLLAYAGWNRIFPMIFFFGWGIALLRDTWQTRKLSAEHLHFIGGAGLMSAVLVGGALIAFGAETFRDSKTNLLMHNSSYSSHRVGFGDLLLFRGERTRAEMKATSHFIDDDGREYFGIAAKEKRIQKMQPTLRLAALGALVFLSVYAFRTRREVWELTPLAILPFFAATNPQINYYNLRVLLFIWHAWGLSTGARPPTFHRLALIVLLIGEVATQTSHLSGNERYTTTCTTSVFLGLYFAVLIGRLVQDGWGQTAGQSSLSSEQAAG